MVQTTAALATLKRPSKIEVDRHCPTHPTSGKGGILPSLLCQTTKPEA